MTDVVDLLIVGAGPAGLAAAIAASRRGLTFRVLEKLLTGDLPEPGAARGVEKAAIRVIYRVAKLAT